MALLLGVVVAVGGVGAGVALMVHVPDCVTFACSPGHPLFDVGLGVAAGALVQAALFFLLAVVLQGMYEMRRDLLRTGVAGVASES